MNTLTRVVNRTKRIVKYGMCAITARPADFFIVPNRLAGPNTNYQKFLVMAHARSASSMVIGTLKKHPEVLCFGEIFVGGRIHFNEEDYDNKSLKSLYLRNRFPVEFLEKSIYSSYRDDISAVGFKVFPDQLASPRFSIVWKWLDANPNIKIISLQRTNLLAAFTSLLIARKYGFGSPPGGTVTVSNEECVREFEKHKRHHEDLKMRLRNHDVMYTSYENMTSDLNRQFDAFQQFLGVNPFPLQVNSKKKEVRPLSQVITNYDELRRSFSGTEWSDFFVD